MSKKIFTIACIGIFFFIILMIGISIFVKETESEKYLPTSPSNSIFTGKITTEDRLAWDFCTNILDGSIKNDQFITLHELTRSQLKNSQKYTIQIVSIVQHQINENRLTGRIDPELIKRVQSLCMEWQEVDLEVITNF